MAEQQYQAHALDMLLFYLESLINPLLVLSHQKKICFLKLPKVCTGVLVKELVFVIETHAIEIEDVSQMYFFCQYGEVTLKPFM